jgi:soluble lytic murein transglycosylase-like protein
MEDTANDLGVKDRFDPEENIKGGSRYLQQQLSRYGDVELALAAYNWGPGNLNKAIRKVKAADKDVTWANILEEVKVPKETRQYVTKVLSKMVEV